MGVIFGKSWSNPMPTEGQVADGKYSYVQGGSFNSPSAGLIYSGGQWLTPAQHQQQLVQHQQQLAQQTTQKVLGTAGNKLSELLQNPSSVEKTPGYQFAYNQGLEAVNRTAAAKGQLGSGNRLYDLTKFGQGLASQTYNNTVSDLTALLNRNQVPEYQMQSYGTDASKIYYGGIGG